MENDGLTYKIKLDNCSEELGEKFIKYLDDNFIYYKIVTTPCFSYNNKTYEVKSFKADSFAVFVEELKKNCVDDIFLYLLGAEYSDDGSIQYKIRYTPNEDILDNNINKLLILFNKLEKFLDKNPKFSASKAKKFLTEETQFSEFEVAKIMEFIRLFCVINNKGE